MAWTDEGSCDGATPTPVQPYESNARYEYGDVVTNQDKQWRCKAVWPDTFRCGQAGYAPGEPYNGVALYEAIKNNHALHVTFIPNIDHLTDVLRQTIMPGDIILLQGAGNIGSKAATILSDLG